MSTGLSLDKGEDDACGEGLFPFLVREDSDQFHKFTESLQECVVLGIWLLRLVAFFLPFCMLVALFLLFCIRVWLEAHSEAKNTKSNDKAKENHSHSEGERDG